MNTLRIVFALITCFPLLPELGLQGFAVLGSAGCFGRVAEWQTRWLQVPVSFGTWGFKSPFAHNERFYELRGIKSRTRNGS